MARPTYGSPAADAYTLAECGRQLAPVVEQLLEPVARLDLLCAGEQPLVESGSNLGAVAFAAALRTERRHRTVRLQVRRVEVRVHADAHDDTLQFVGVGDGLVDRFARDGGGVDSKTVTGTPSRASNVASSKRPGGPSGRQTAVSGIAHVSMCSSPRPAY